MRLSLIRISRTLSRVNGDKNRNELQKSRKHPEKVGKTIQFRNYFLTENVRLSNDVRIRYYGARD